MPAVYILRLIFILAVAVRECLGKILLHEFPMFHSHTEWYFLFSLVREKLNMPSGNLKALFLKWPLKPFNYKNNNVLLMCGLLQHAI